MMNLTSIDINSYQLGIEAAAQLSKHIENPALFATKIIVPYFWWKEKAAQRELIIKFLLKRGLDDFRLDKTSFFVL